MWPLSRLKGQHILHQRTTMVKYLFLLPKISFKKEFKFLTKLNHKNICKFEGVFETENSTYVIMELLSFSLYGYLQKYGFPNEVKVKKIMKGLL